MASDTQQHYEVLSVGSGEAGKYICWTLASSGKKCAVIEERWLGGSCPNVSCLPTKNIIYSANVVHNARSDVFGLPANWAAVDMSVVRQRKREMVEGLIQMHKQKFSSSGAELIFGHGEIVGPNTVQVVSESGEKRVFTTDHLIICTGSRAKIDGTIPGLVEASPLTHVEMLEIEEVPSHLVVLGGGYVGLELAQAMRRLGARVTVVERNQRILKSEDNDVSSVLHEVLTAEGVEIRTSSTVKSIEGISGIKVTLHLEGNSSIEASHILAATGRIPNTSGIGLQENGIKLTLSGHVKVDPHLRTTADGVFAVGDCAGSPHFTHIAFDDFRIVVQAITGSGTRSTANRQIPSTLFTSPEVAHIGLSETEAKAQNITYRLAKIPMTAFLRTRTLGETTGFAKALIGKNDKILGFTAVGAGVGELLPVVQLAMSEGLTYDRIGNLIITHPTLSEGLVALFSSVLPL